MTQKTRADLLTQFATDLPDNNTAEIAPLDLRTAVDNLADSAFILDTDKVEDLKATSTDTGKVLAPDGAGGVTFVSPATGGDFVGPASAVDSNLVSFDGTTGKLGKDSGLATADVMLQTVYDTDDNGIVDNSEKLNNQAGSYYLDRTNHTGTQTASTISDFDTEVSNNTSVTANTAKVSNIDHTGPVTSIGAATSVTANAIDNVMLSDMPALTIKGNDTGGSADPKNLTVPEAQSLLGIVAGATIGIDGEDESVSVGTDFTTINFLGAGVTAVDGGSGVLDVTVAGGGGEANTGSNVNVGGVGVFKQKAGVDLEFKGVNAGSNKITVTDDVANNEIDVDIDESNITVENLSTAETNTDKVLGNDGLGGLDWVDNVTLSYKAGEKLAGAFSGNPKVATVTFATAFPSTAYSITLTADVSNNSQAYTPQVSNKLAGGFDITLTTNSVSNLNAVTWLAIEYGES